MLSPRRLPPCPIPARIISLPLKPNFFSICVSFSSPNLQSPNVRLILGSSNISSTSAIMLVASVALDAITNMNFFLVNSMQYNINIFISVVLPKPRGSPNANLLKSLDK